MNEHPSPDENTKCHRLGEAIASLMSALDEGQVDVSALKQRYPDVANELDSFLSAQRELFAVLSTSSTNNQLEDTRDSNFLGYTHPETEDRSGKALGRYAVQQRIGAGGMGEVYLARDTALGKLVALKLLPSGFSLEFRKRLLREACMSAKLQHPNIATFYEANEVDGIHFIAMEYVRGKTLRERLHGGKLPLDDVLTLTAAILESLAHAHANNLLHRDIKPENLMLAENGTIKLLDFGLAKPTFNLPPQTVETEAASDFLDLEQADVTQEFVVVAQHPPREDANAASLYNLTHAGAVLGTPGYLSPEQIRGIPLDFRSDLFAVGAVVYELLTGQRAFPGKTFRERLLAAFNPAIPNLEHPSIPTPFRDFLRRALEKDRERRFDSTQAMLVALKEISRSGVENGLSRTLAIFEFKNRQMAHGKEIGCKIKEQLHTHLASSEKYQVLPPGQVAEAQQRSIFNESALGAILACRWVLSSSFETDADAINLTARLEDIATGQCESIGRWCCPHSDLNNVVRKVANEVARRLAADDAPTSRASASVSPDAYHLYVQARQAMKNVDKNSMELSLDLLDQCVAIAPDFAPALALQTQLLSLRNIYIKDAELAQRAIEIGTRATTAGPELAEAHMWLGYAQGAEAMRLSSILKDHLARPLLDASISSTRRAIDLSPTESLPTYFLAGALQQLAGRFTANHDERLRIRLEAMEILQNNLSIHPQQGYSLLALGFVHADLGAYEEAERCLAQSVMVEPQLQPPTAGVAVFLGECLRRAGKLEQARTQCLAGLEKTEETDHMYRDTFRGVGLCALGRTAVQQADWTTARAAYTQVIQLVRGRSYFRLSGQFLVQAYAGLTRAGDGVEPFELGLQLFEERKATLDFSWLWWGWDEISLLELARAAKVLGRTQQAADLLDRARKQGSTEALSEASFQSL